MTLPSSILRFPPELLSFVFSRCDDSSLTYHQLKSLYARLCLVNRYFLAIARELLYSRLLICSRENFDKEIWIEAQPEDLGLIRTLQNVEACYSHVREVHVARSTIGPEVVARCLAGIVLRASGLQKLWFLEGVQAQEREEEEEQEEQGKGEVQLGQGKDGEVVELESKDIEHEEEDLSSTTQEQTDRSTDSSRTTSRKRAKQYKAKVNPFPGRNTITELCKILINCHKHTLKTLVIPGFPLSELDVFALFMFLEKLEIYKGPIPTPPDDPADRPWVVASLQRLWITTALDRSTFDFLRPAVSNSLRFLHFSTNANSGPVSLGHLPRLEQLCITVQVLYSGFTVRSPEGGGEIDISIASEETVGKALDNIVTSITSLEAPNLESFALNINVDGVRGEWVESFERLFSVLPSSLTEIAIGRIDTSSLPSSIFIKNLGRFPSLDHLRLVRPSFHQFDESDLDDSPPVTWYDDPALFSRSVKISVMSRVEWQAWKMREFYPEASEDEAKPYLDEGDLASEEEGSGAEDLAGICNLM
ncbi:hypothetical protein JCM5350_002172 [Sporobolomyces pararoseus]